MELGISVQVIENRGWTNFHLSQPPLISRVLIALPIRMAFRTAVRNVENIVLAMALFHLCLVVTGITSIGAGAVRMAVGAHPIGIPMVDGECMCESRILP